MKMMVCFSLEAHCSFIDELFHPDTPTSHPQVSIPCQGQSSALIRNVIFSEDKMELDLLNRALPW